MSSEFSLGSVSVPPGFDSKKVQELADLANQIDTKNLTFAVIGICQFRILNDDWYLQFIVNFQILFSRLFSDIMGETEFKRILYTLPTAQSRFHEHGYDRIVNINCGSNEMLTNLWSNGLNTYYYQVLSYNPNWSIINSDYLNVLDAMFWIVSYAAR